MSDADVGIVIVTYRSIDDIAVCLRSIAAQTSVAHEVVVVDNASDDGTADLVESAFPDVQLVRSSENLGFAGGVNLGARSVSGRYLLLLNPDTELRSAVVDELVRVADSAPSHRVYGGRTIDEVGDPDPRSAWGLPTPWSLLCFATGLTTAFKRNRWLDPESLGAWDRDTQREVDAVSGCLQLIDRSLWDELGGLDETYFMYGEDADWAWRARRAGARPLLVPSAEIMHRLGASSTSDRKRVLVMTGKSTYLRKHWGRRAWLGLGLLEVGTFVRGPLANTVRRMTRRPPDHTWAAAWSERVTWRQGW